MDPRRFRFSVVLATSSKQLEGETLKGVVHSRCFLEGETLQGTAALIDKQRTLMIHRTSLISCVMETIFIRVLEIGCGYPSAAISIPQFFRSSSNLQRVLRPVQVEENKRSRRLGVAWDLSYN